MCGSSIEVGGQLFEAGDYIDIDANQESLRILVSKGIARYALERDSQPITVEVETNVT